MRCFAPPQHAAAELVANHLRLVVVIGRWVQRISSQIELRPYVVGSIWKLVRKSETPAVIAPIETPPIAPNQSDDAAPIMR